MPLRSVTFRILADSRQARAELDWIAAKREELERGVEIPVDVYVAPAMAQLVALRNMVDSLKTIAANLHVGLEGDKVALAQLANLESRLYRVGRIVAKPTLSIDGFLRAKAEIASLDASVDGLILRLKEAEFSWLGFLTGMSFGRGGGRFGLGGKVNLFGGIGQIAGLTLISTWHLVADAILEVAAVAIPAAVALTAFGIAGMDAAVAIYTHMSNVHTVMDATGRAIPPMTGALEALHRAVVPEVYQLFGDALTVMAAKTGVFAQLAIGAAHAVDFLAARATVALTSGGGLGQFMSGAVHDLALLGNIFGNIFGIIGNLLRAMAGWAGILFTFISGFTHLLEVVSAALVPVLNIAVAFHGFIIWAGLAFTAVLLLGKGLQTLVVQLAAGVVKLVAWATSAVIAAGATTVLDGALAILGAVNPLVWVAAGVAAITALTVVMLKSKTATQQWLDSLQAGLQKVPVGNLLSKIGQDQVKVTDALAQATVKLNSAQQGVSNRVVPARAGVDALTIAYMAQTQKVSELAAGNTKLVDGANLVRYRVQALAKTYGSTAAVEFLLSKAGVTSAQMLDKQAEAWKIIQQMVKGTSLGYGAMTNQMGTLGNNVAMLDSQMTSQYKAVQTLNQGWDTFTANMTNTQNNFDTFALGLKTLTSTATTASVTLGRAHLHLAGLGNAIDGLTKKDLALNQAFTQQIVNTNALFDSWRQAGIAGNLFTEGVKASIAPMVRFARGSQEATAQLVGLAQEAGFRGPATLSALTDWLGNVHGAMQKVKSITNQATLQEALLTGSMRAQGSFIANQLIGDINSGIMAYTKVKQAAYNYGLQVARFGADSQPAITAQGVLNRAIIAGGIASHDTTNQIAAMIAKVDKIPLKKAIEIVESGLGHFTISGGTTIVRGPGALKHGTPGQSGAAHGWFVNAGSGPAADDVLARVSKGELIVPAHMVGAGMVDHLRGRIPGFGAGGVVGSNPLLTGNLGVLSGQAAVDFNNQFIGQFTSAMESAMRAATMSAMNAATASFRGGAPGFGSSSAAMRFAQGLLGAYGWGSQWPALFSLWQRESGWNAYAVNPTSGAYGIPQALGHGHPFNLGDYANQIRWGLAYIRSRYGSPNAAWAHEVSAGWYDQGGMLPPGLSLAYNGTGAPEPVIAPRGPRLYGGRGDVYNIMVKGDTDPDGAALRIIQKVRDYKRHHGNQATGIG